MDYKQFQVGEIFSGTVSWHIPNSNDGFFVVKDKFVGSLEPDDEKDLMWWIPQEGEMFYITNSEGEGESFFRCQRLPLASTSKMRIQMIDIGETHTIKISELNAIKMYVMPEHFKDIPPRAIKCRGNESFVEEEASDAASLLASFLYRQFTFEVVAIEQDHLLVDIHPFDNSQEWDEEMAEEELKHGSPENLAMEIEKKENKVARHEMSIKEQEMWDEEPLNTSNPQIALQGFQTRDDDRLCKFYDPKTGGCWKGGRCKLRHVAELKDGTLRDTVESHFNDIEKSLPLPKLHSNIQLRVTQMITNNRFWCLYESLKKTKDGCDLKKLTDFMNLKEEVETYEKLKDIPHIKQLVLYKSKDGKFKRGRVEELVEEDGVQVLLVDEGTVSVAPLKYLYRWGPRLDFLPFQAVEIELANIKQDDKADKTKIFKHLQNENGKPLIGFVLDVTEIRCTLLDSNGNDIGETLVELGLAEEKKPLPPITVTFGLPG